MKKFAMFLTLVLAFALILPGCTSSDQPEQPDQPETQDEYSFALDSTQENVISVTMNNASQGSGGVGYLSFGENEYLFYETQGDNDADRVHVVIFYKDEPENPLSYSDPEGDNVYLDFTVDNNTSSLLGMEPGDYAFLIEVDSASFDGTARFSVYEDSQIANPWMMSEDPADLEAALGFGVEIPEEFAGMHPVFYNYAPELLIASISYAETMEDGTEYLKGDIRKAPSYAVDVSQGLSGVWDTYDQTKRVDGVRLSFIEGLVRVAEWEADGYAYSVWCQDGLPEEEMMAVVGQVK